MDDVVVGAMGAHNAMQFFKRGVLLITPGDREDILLAAGATTDAAKRRKNGRHRPDRRPAPGRERAQSHLQTMPIPVLLAQGGQLSGRVQGPQSHRQDAADDAEKISLIRDIVAKNVNVKKIIESLVICPSLPLNHRA